MILQTRANTIAEAANECCSRSDGWQDVIQAVALEQLRAVVEAERESLLALLERCIEVMEFAYMNAAEQPREIEEARAAIRARKP